MAAKTPTKVIRLSGGDHSHLLVQFADIDDADTYASGLKGILDFQVENRTDGVVVSATLSTSTFTFTVAGSGSNKAVTLHVYQRA